MLKPVLQNPWVQAAAVAAGLVLLCLAVYILSPVLVPLLFAFIVAYILDPVVDFFEARRIPRSATIAVIALIAVLLILTVPVFLIPSLVTQAEHLISAASQSVTQGALSGWVDGLLDALRVPDLLRMIEWAPANATQVDTRAILAERIGTYVKDHALQLLRSYGPQVANAGQWASVTAAQMLASLGRTALGFVMLIANLALFTFVTAYLLRDFNRVVDVVKELVPPRQRDHVFDVIRKIDHQVHGFLRGQMLVCVCMATLYMIGLSIVRVPFGVLVGLCGGAASFVPYLDLALAMPPALLLTALQFGLDWHVVGVLAAFGIAQGLSGAILTPKIVGKQVGLNPVWVILAILVFSSMLGFLGLLVAVPLAAALKVLVLEAVTYYRGSSLFAEVTSAGGSEAPDSLGTDD